MSESSDRWIAIVYDGTDKIDSRTFNGERQDVSDKANDWIDEYYVGHEWALHHIVNQ